MQVLMHPKKRLFTNTVLTTFFFQSTRLPKVTNSSGMQWPPAANANHHQYVFFVKDTRQLRLTTYIYINAYLTK